MRGGEELCVCGASKAEERGANKQGGAARHAAAGWGPAAQGEVQKRGAAFQPGAREGGCLPGCLACLRLTRLLTCSLSVLVLTSCLPSLFLLGGVAAHRGGRARLRRWVEAREERRAGHRLPCSFAGQPGGVPHRPPEPAQHQCECWRSLWRCRGCMAGKQAGKQAGIQQHHHQHH